MSRNVQLAPAPTGLFGLGVRRGAELSRRLCWTFRRLRVGSWIMLFGFAIPIFSVYLPGADGAPGPDGLLHRAGSASPNAASGLYRVLEALARGCDVPEWLNAALAVIPERALAPSYLTCAAALGEFRPLTLADTCQTLVAKSPREWGARGSGGRGCTCDSNAASLLGGPC